MLSTSDGEVSILEEAPRLASAGSGCFDGAYSRRFRGNVGTVDADGFYRQFSPSPVFTMRSDDEEKVDGGATARDVVEETLAPPSPVSIAAATERAFF